jgi:very-short-patch-repair endonuclease
MKQDMFTMVCKSTLGIELIKEYMFCSGRKWRFDYAIPELKIAIEQDGGVWSGGRHTRPVGYLKDLDKFNTAASMGWIVLKFTPSDMFKADTFNIIKETVSNKSNEKGNN